MSPDHVRGNPADLTLVRALAFGAVGYAALMGIVLVRALRAAATSEFYEMYEGRIPWWDRLAFVGAEHIPLRAG